MAEFDKWAEPEFSDDEFRMSLRCWLEENYPVEWKQDTRRPFRRLRGDHATQWLRTVNDEGWRMPAWPRKYGGLGLSFRKQFIYHEELERAGVARIIDLGETQLGPILIQLGTEKQKEYYLPRICNCEHVWCQGYSEPNAGSDLASLRTQATVEGDELVINGQKIWTTHANDSTHIFVLVRTGKFDKRQQGITFLLVPLDTSGITIHPIINIAGEDEFCEVFFDNVRVPLANIVGNIHEGWAIAKALLGYERVWIGSPALAGKALALARRLVIESGQEEDSGVTDKLAQLAADLHDYRILYSQTCDRISESQEQPGPEVSALKVYASELLQRITDFNVEISHEHAGVVGETRLGQMITDLHWQQMMSRPVTVFAGANEIQRDILARTVLKLTRQ